MRDKGLVTRRIDEKELHEIVRAFVGMETVSANINLWLNVRVSVIVAAHSVQRGCLIAGYRSRMPF